MKYRKDYFFSLHMTPCLLSSLFNKNTTWWPALVLMDTLSTNNVLLYLHKGFAAVAVYMAMLLKP